MIRKHFVFSTVPEILGNATIVARNVFGRYSIIVRLSGFFSFFLNSLPGFYIMILLQLAGLSVNERHMNNSPYDHNNVTGTENHGFRNKQRSSLQRLSLAKTRKMKRHLRKVLERRKVIL